MNEKTDSGAPHSLRRWATRALGLRRPALTEAALADPLLHLGALLDAPQPDTVTLNTLNARIDENIRRNPARAGHFLKTAFHAYDGPRTPVLDRLLIQALDAEWRGQADQAEKGRALRRKLNLFETTYGTVPATLLYRGALALRAGGRQEAFALQARAAHEIGPVGMPWMHIGAHGLRPDAGTDWQDEVTPRFIADTQPQIDWYRTPKNPGPITLVAGGDSAFFHAYGPSLQASLRAYDTTCTLHFHIVNMTPRCAAAIDALDDPCLSVTTERYPHADDRGYFASVRFYRLGEIRARLPQPAYITDLDNVVTQPIESARAAFSTADAAWHNHASQTWFPWWGPSAANTYIGTGPGGEQIADWMRAYLAARFRPGNFFKSWWIDQLMLNEIAHAAQEKGLHTITSRVPALTLSHPLPNDQRLSIRSAFLAGDFAD
jgi:hypothetical protein